MEFPSLLEQLKNAHLVRKRIYKVILGIIGFEEDEIENLIALWFNYILLKAMRN